MKTNKSQSAKQKQLENKYKTLDAKQIKEIFLPKPNVKLDVAYGLFWFSVTLLLLIPMTLFGKYSVENNFLTTSIVGMTLTILWVCLRFGFFESFFFRFKNRRILKFMNHYQKGKSFKPLEITKVEYRNHRKTKPWWGIIVLGSLSTLLFVVFAIIIYS